MLNVPRFQLALNSDDPDIVKLGLRQFLQQVLQEQAVEDAFGQDSITATPSADFQAILHPKPPNQITGLLRSYLDASPQIEEFFVLWELPNRLLDPELCGLHMQCLSAVLYCCSDHLQFCRYAVNRIMNLSQQLMIKQLDMNDAFVTQMTLSVVIQCYRINKQLPEELFGCVLSGLSSKSLISHIDQYSNSIGLVETRPSLAILCYLLIDNHLEPSYAIRIFKDEKGLKNLFRELVNSSNRAVHILLQGILYLAKTSHLVKDYISKFISRMVLGKIADLSVSKDEIKSNMADSFLLELSNILAKMLSEGESQSKSARKNISNCINDLLDSLKPLSNDVHSQIQLILIRANPGYLKKCICSLKLQSWDPLPIPQYLDSLEHLVFLLRDSNLDETVAARCVSLLHEVSSVTINNLRTFCSATVLGLLPPGLTKKEMNKLLLHDNDSLRLAGIKVAHQVLLRLEKMFDSVLQQHRAVVENVVVDCICEVIPEFAILYNAHANIFNSLTCMLKPSISPSEQVVQEDMIDMDIQLNLGDDDNDMQTLIPPEQESSSTMNDVSKVLTQQREEVVVDGIKEYFKCLTVWCRIAPITVARSKCDILKFIDDFLTAISQDNMSECPPTILFAVATVTSDVLALVDFFDERRMCSWFGNEDEAGKLLNAIIVNDNWRTSTKKTTLYKLFLLTSLSNDLSVRTKSSNFKIQLLLRSGLFGDNPYENIDLVHEAVGWVQYCEDSDSVLLLETLLRLSFHFAPSVGAFMHKKGMTSIDVYCSSLMQVVLVFCIGNMSPLQDFLPKFIQTYIQGLHHQDGAAVVEGQKTREQSIAFFEKFNRGFRTEVERLAISIVTHTLSTSRNFSTSCNLYAQFSVFQSFFPSSKILGIISRITTTTTIDFKGKSNEVFESQLNDDFLSTMDFCLHHFKRIVCSIDGKSKSTKGKSTKKSTSDEAFSIDKELLCFVDKYWKFLSLRVLNNAKLSNVPNEFFGWLEIQCKYEKFENQQDYQLSAFFMFCLNCLALLNDHLIRRVKCESDMEKTKCSNCFALADFLGDLSLKLLDKIIYHTEIISQILACSLVQFSIGSDHAFGMLCRNVYSVILESNYVSRINRKDLQQKIDHVVTLLTDKVVIKSAMLDPSFFRLLTAVSKVVEETETTNVAFQHLLRAYCNLKIVMTSTLSQTLHEMNGEAGGVVPCEDPVYRIGEFSPFHEYDTLLNTIMEKVYLRKGGSPFLLPSVRELKDGSWSFFDFFSIASSNSDRKLSRRLVYRQLYADETVSVLHFPTNYTFVGAGPIYNVDLLEEYALLLQDELKSLDCLKIVEAVEKLIRTAPSSESWVAITTSVLTHLKLNLSHAINVLSLCLLFDDLAKGGSNLMNGSLLISLITLAQKTSSHPLRNELMTEVVDLCIHQFKENFDKASAAKQFYLSQIIDFAISVANSTSFEEQSIWQSIDKWIKLCLWSRIGEDNVISAIRHLMVNLYKSECTSLPSMESSLNPLKMLRLVVAHQSLGEIFAMTHDSPDNSGNISELNNESISDGNNKTKNRTPVLLRLILSLVKIVGNYTFEEKPLVATFQKLQKLLVLYYKGTFSESDRIIYRVLSILFEKHKVGCPLHQIKPVFVVSSSSAADSWLYQYIKPPTVYNTLASFPLWRSLLPQPFAWEPLANQERESFCEKNVNFKGKFYGNQRHATEYHIDNPLAAIDFNVSSSSSQYDPAYLVLIILSCLKKYDVSIRQLTNCGGLSIVIASLGSKCALIRTYAVACLSMIWKLANEQDAEKDPSFRERPQILQLLSFLRNSIEQSSMNNHNTQGRGMKDNKSLTQQPSIRKSIAQMDSDGSIFQLPLTTSIFLAKAALHMMQPKHELYIPTNLYLIGRPICDIRDVPLFDLLVQNADSETEQSERLSVLRSIRDGLRSHQDHLNLCRKHAYSKLMLLFPIFAIDHRAGHAIFDIMDNACRHRESTRYLVEKCNFAVWLQKFVFLPLTIKNSMPLLAESAIDAAFAIHAITVLRRLLSSIFVLEREGIVSGQSECFATVNVFVIAAMQHIDSVIQDTDYLSSLLLLCWEAGVIQRHCNSTSSNQSHQMLDWISLQDFAFTLYENYCLKRKNYECFGTIALLIAHSGSVIQVSEEWTRLLSPLIQDMIRLLLLPNNSIMSTKDKSNPTYLISSPLSAVTESTQIVKQIDLMNVGTVALVDTIVNDEFVLSPGLPFTDRMDLVWDMLSHRIFGASDPLPEKLGLSFISMHFAAFLHHQLSASAVLVEIRKQSVVWCLTIWNLYFSGIGDQCCTDSCPQFFVAGEFHSTYSSIIKLLVPHQKVAGVSDHKMISLSMLKSVVDVASSLISLDGHWNDKCPQLKSLCHTLIQHTPTKESYAKYITACEATFRFVQIGASLESKHGQIMEDANVVRYLGNAIYFLEAAVDNLPHAQRVDQKQASPAEALLAIFQERGFFTDHHIKQPLNSDTKERVAARVNKLKRSSDATTDGDDTILEGYVRLKKRHRRWQPLSRSALLLFK